MRLALIIVSVVVVLCVILWIAGQLRYNNRRDGAIKRFWAAAASESIVFDRTMVTDSGLPLVVRRYLGRAIPDGNATWQQVEITQSGEMRQALDKPWMPLVATQLVSAQPRAFVWMARVRAAPGVSFHALDRLDNCRGTFSGALFGLVEVAGSSGPEVDVSTLLRYLSEAVWLPHALFPSDTLRWEAIDETRARAVLRCGDIHVSGVFTFDDEARPVEFFTDERYRDVDGELVRTDWRVEYSEHRRVHGVEIPHRGTVSWHTPDGYFSAIKLRIDAVVLRAEAD